MHRFSEKSYRYTLGDDDAVVTCSCGKKARVQDCENFLSLVEAESDEV